MRRLFLIWMLVSLGELGAKPISFYEEQTGESGVGELVEATMNFEFVLDGKPKTLRFNGELLGTLEMAEREIAEDLVWQLNTENSIRKYMDPLEVLIVLENGEPRVGVKLVQFFVPPGYRRPSGASLLEPSVEVDRSKLKINKSYILYEGGHGSPSKEVFNEFFALENASRQIGMMLTPLALRRVAFENYPLWIVTVASEYDMYNQEKNIFDEEPVSDIQIRHVPLSLLRTHSADPKSLPFETRYSFLYDHALLWNKYPSTTLPANVFGSGMSAIRSFAANTLTDECIEKIAVLVDAKRQRVNQ